MPRKFLFIPPKDVGEQALVDRQYVSIDLSGQAEATEIWKQHYGGKEGGWQVAEVFLPVNAGTYQDGSKDYPILVDIPAHRYTRS